MEDRFVVGTSSTGSGGSYTNSTTVFPVANNTGDLVCVYRNGIKLVHTTDFVVSASGNTVTLQSASNTADEITVHVIGILQHSNFVPTSGGTFTGNVGIGTTNLSNAKLQIQNSNDATTWPLAVYNDNGNLGFYVTQSSGGDQQLKVNNNSGTTNVQLNSNGDSYFNGGNLAVGTASPISRVHIHTNATDTIPTNPLAQNTDNNVITVRNENNSANYSGLKLEVRTSGASAWLIANEWQSQYLGDLVFRVRSDGTNSSERMRIKTNGNVTISSGDLETSTTGKIKQKGAFMQSSTHQALALGA